jgi:hypothetical protein
MDRKTIDEELVYFKKRLIELKKMEKKILDLFFPLFRIRYILYLFSSFNNIT